MFKRKPMTFIVALLAAVSLTTSIKAQPMGELVPEDALVYIGWRGASDLGPAYAALHLKAVLDSSNIPEVFDQFLPALTSRLPERGPREAEALAPIGAISWAMWKYPTAFYFGGVDFPEDGPPMPRAAFMCKSGAETDELVETLRSYIGEDGQSPFKLTSKDGMVTLTIGKIPAVGKGLAGNAKFASAMKQVGKEPVFVAYADVEGVLTLVETSLIKSNENDAKKFTEMRDLMGLKGLKRVVLTAGFEGKDWATRAFIEAPAGSRTGILSLLEGQPISDGALKLVPKSAAWVTAMRFDVGKLISDIHTMLGKIDPRAQKPMDEAFAEINKTLGIDVQKDLLAVMGDEWLIYTDGQVAGTGMMGMVAINRARDGKKLAATLTKLQKMLDQELVKSMRLEGEWKEVDPDDNDDPIAPPANAKKEPKEEETRLVRTHVVDGVTLNYLSVPAVAPTWAVDGDVVYMAMYPQVVASAIAVNKQGGPSILEHPGFAALHKQLNGSGKVSSINFVDLPQTAGEGYQVSLLLSQLLMGAGDMMGVRSPPLMLPPFHKLRPHLTPAGGVTWTDAGGWHMASITPFPGAELIGTQHQMLVATQAMTVGIMLPALGSARRTARMMQSGTQARAIMQGCVLWAQGAKGKYPPDVATLLEGSYISPEYLISPRDSVKIPPDLMKWTKEKRAEWVNANTSYCYITGLTEDYDSQKVAVFERLHSPDLQMIAVCFNDNHVETLSIEEASALIKKQTGRSLEEWSKAKNPGAGGK